MRGAVLDDLRSNDLLSRGDRALARSVRAKRLEHQAVTGVVLSDEAVASALKVSVSRISRLQPRAPGTFSEREVANVADASSASPADPADSAEMVGVIRKFISQPATPLTKS